MKRSGTVLLALGLCVVPVVTGAEKATRAQTVEIIDVKRIWDQAQHNAFTDLIRFKESLFCVVRESDHHWRPGVEGKIRVITSSEGAHWQSAALIAHAGEDLRDPKISQTPDGHLMLTYFRRFNPSRYPEQHEQTFVRLSENGSDWSDAAKIGAPDRWLWRVTWHRAVAYGMDYGGPDTQAPFSHPRTLRLLESADGRQFGALAEFEYAGESTLRFREDTALCLARAGGDRAMLGLAQPPYTQWTWNDLQIKLGGPNFIQIQDGRWIAAGRLYDGGARTSLLWLDPEAGTLTECLTLPSGGDTSYPGLVWHAGVLWMSYYSSHEGKSSIYLARVRLNP